MYTFPISYGMKVTIFGLAGTGKSSVAEAVAAQLGWEFMSNGNLFRELAKEHGMQLNTFEKLAEKDESIDRKVDAKTKVYGKTHDNFVFEARLAWHFIPDSFKLKLYCEDAERFRRIAGRDRITLEEAARQTEEREQSIRKRYKEIYGIEDFSDDTNFDRVIDTTPIDLAAVINVTKDIITSHPQYQEA